MDKASLHFPGTDIESPDIVIVRDGHRYRLLHGHLRLANVLRFTPFIEVEIRGEGRARIMKTAIGYVVATGAPELQLPLYPD